MIVEHNLTLNSEGLSDKAYHQILETLFRAVKSDVSTYARATKASQKTTITSRLSACASILRTAVEVGVRKLRLKTVKAFFDHVTQTLPMSEGYCEPLIADYFKSLKIVLEYSPHPEHLTREEWHDVTDFCIQAMNTLVIPSDTDNLRVSYGLKTSTPYRHRASRSATPSLRSNQSHTQANGSSARIETHTGLENSTEALLLCLKLLTSTSNAPVLEKAQILLRGLLDFVSSSYTDLVLQAAFEAINAILCRINTNDTFLTSTAVTELIPLISRCWLTKSASLKDHLLVSLLYAEPFLPHLLLSNEAQRYRDSLIDLLDVFKDEYCRRRDRDQLQLEDLMLTGTMTKQQKEKPLSIPVFRLRLGALRPESSWTLLHITASITECLSKHASVEGEGENAEDRDWQSKRRKVETPFENTLQNIRLSAVPEKLHALQVLCFVFGAVEIELSVVQSFLDTIISLLSDEASSLASWAMLATARYISRI